MSVVGIDFGDENLTIACARRGGIDVLQNEVGKRKTSSGFCCHHVQRHIGSEFPGQFQSNAANSIIYLKRLVGKMFNDPEVAHEQKFLYSQLVADDQGRVAIQATHLGKKVLITPEQGVAVLLKRLRETFELNSEGAKMKDCVISVPAYFSDAQRRSMIDATKIAGLNVLRLINETTAVALQYGTGRPIADGEVRRVAYFDMGVASTDVALVLISNQGLKVEKFASDRCLGGRDFDELLATFLNDQIKKKYKIDAYSTAKSLIKLRKEADRVKQILSANTKVPYSIEYLLDGVDVAGMVLREEFEALLETHFKERILAPLRKVFEGIDVSDVASLHSIELLGGTSRVPYVQTLLKEAFGRELSKTCDADESICRGATLQCAMISPSFKVREYVVQDISAYPMGISWSNDASDSILVFSEFNKIPSVKAVTIKNATFPLKVQIKYMNEENARADPTVANILVNAPQGITLPPGPAPVTLKLKLDANCVVSLLRATISLTQEVDSSMNDAVETPETPVAEGTEAEGGEAAAAAAAAPKTTQITVDCPYTFNTPFNLTPAQFNKACDQEIDMASADRLVMETNQARNAFEAYILSMRPRAKPTGDLHGFFAPGEAEKFVEHCNQQENWLEDEGYDESLSVYQGRLAQLSSEGNPALTALNESTQRDVVMQNALEEAEKVRNFSNITTDKYSHITSEERGEVQKLVKEFCSWAETVSAKQKSLKAYEKPAFTSQEVQSKIQAVVTKARTIMGRPVPKPTPAPTPAKNDEPAQEKEKDAASSPDTESTENSQETEGTENAENAENADAMNDDKTDSNDQE